MKFDQIVMLVIKIIEEKGILEITFRNIKTSLKKILEFKNILNETVFNMEIYGDKLEKKTVKKKVKNFLGLLMGGLLVLL